MAERNHGNETFQNGSELLGILKAPGRLNTEQRKALKRIMEAIQIRRHAGTRLSGWTTRPSRMTLEDAEWIEARKFSVIEVCRLFRVPPVIVQSMESAPITATALSLPANSSHSEPTPSPVGLGAGD
jgi:phage portal protein BeeE